MKKRYHISRDNGRDLHFAGELIGRGEHGAGRGATVTIYRRTHGGRYVVHATQWSQWQGEGEDSVALLCATPQDVRLVICSLEHYELERAGLKAWAAAELDDE